MVVRLIEAGDFTAYPDALRFIIAVQGRRDPRCRSVLVQEREALPAQDPARHLRRGRDRRFDVATGVSLLDSSTPTYPAGFRPRQAGPGDLPDGRAELGVDAEAAIVMEDALPGLRRRRPAGWPRLALPEATTRSCWPRGADIVVTTLDEVDLAALSQGRLAIRPAVM